MKILIINDKNKNPGGAEIYIQMLTQLLKNEGQEVYLYEKAIEPNNKLMKFCLGWLGINHYLAIQKITKQFKPDLTFVQSIKYTGPLFLTIMRVKNIPVIMTFANLYEYTLMPISAGIKSLENFKKIIHRFFIKKYVDNFLALSHTLKQWIIGNLKINSNNIFLLHNPIFWPVSHFNKPIKKTSKKNTNLLFVGRLVKNKGVDLVLQAVNILQNQYHLPVNFTIVGEGPEKASLKKYVKNNNLKNVFFLGYIDHTKVETVYDKADMLIHPSRCIENSPLVTREAMSKGLPIISSYIPGSGQVELLKNGGSVQFDSENASMLAQQIKKLIQDPDYTYQLAQKAYKQSLQYSQEKWVKSLLSIFKQITAQ